MIFFATHFALHPNFSILQQTPMQPTRSVKIVRPAKSTTVLQTTAVHGTAPRVGYLLRNHCRNNGSALRANFKHSPLPILRIGVVTGTALCPCSSLLISLLKYSLPRLLYFLCSVTVDTSTCSLFRLWVFGRETMYVMQIELFENSNTRVGEHHRTTLDTHDKHWLVV